MRGRGVVAGLVFVVGFGCVGCSGEPKPLPPPTTEGFIPEEVESTCTGPLEAGVCLTTDDASELSPDRLESVWAMASGNPTAQGYGGPDLSTLNQDGVMAGFRTSQDGPLLEIGTYEGQEFYPLVTDEEEPFRRVLALSSNGEKLAWLETSDAEEPHTDWRLVCWSGGEARVLATSEDLALDEEKQGVDRQEVRVSAGVVYWTFPATKKGGGQTLVLARMLCNGEVGSQEILADDVGNLATDERGAIYHTALSVDGVWGLVTWRDETSQTTIDTLTEGAMTVNGLGAGKVYHAWSVVPSGPSTGADGGWIYVLNTQTYTLTEIAVSSPGAPTIAVSGSWVAWGKGPGSGDDGQYLFDASNGVIWRLGESACSQAAVSGNAVAWYTPGEDEPCAPRAASIPPDGLRP
ncbi:MAG: hypothetical protein FWD59_00380 [Micrococcales bacterium]|nr:hypothetical protein [Micrococcales bacterium]